MTSDIKIVAASVMRGKADLHVLVLFHVFLKECVKPWVADKNHIRALVQCSRNINNSKLLFHRREDGCALGPAQHKLM